MIIKDDKVIEPTTQGQVQAEIPPPYSPSSQSATPSSQGTISTAGSTNSHSISNQSIILSRLSRANFVYIRREHDSILDQFLIDPYLQATGGRQPERNLQLECIYGNIEANVWIAGGEGPPHYGRWKKRTSLGVQVENGIIHLKLGVECTTHPFSLHIQAQSADVRIELPSSFFGPLTTRTLNGSVRVSNALSSQTTTFSDVNGTRKCFVGDFISSGYGNKEWSDSIIDIRCINGNVRLSYKDEVFEDRRGKSSSALLSRTLPFSNH